MLPDAADEIAGAILQARALHFRHAAIETAGLFWAAVELLILYAVLVARRYLGEHPLPAALALTRTERRRAWVWACVFACVSALLYARHTVLTPVHRLLESAETGVTLASVSSAYGERVHEHLAIWAAFITLWVVLEILIVYHGWRAFCLLRARIRIPHAETV